MASLVHPSSAVDVPLMMLPGASAPPSQIVLLDRVIARNFGKGSTFEMVLALK